MNLSKSASAYSADRRLSAVRIRLGADRPARQPDSLGRARIGYRAGLSTSELWDRGRGVWRAKTARVSATSIVLLTHDGVVRLVGTVEGVRFIGAEDRVAIEGQPLPRHPLVGKPDPLHNDSRNSVAYGDVVTIPPDPAVHGSGDTVLANLTRALTEAAQAGGDWAELVTLGLAGAAANMGGIEEVLSSRPGSWEAAEVRSLLRSTVGEDESDLWRHRTEPVHISLADALGKLDEQQGAAEEAAAEMIDVARARFDEQIRAHCWTYERRGDTFVCADPAAPVWDQAHEQWRADQRTAGTPPETINALLSEFLAALDIPKSDSDRAAIRQLEEAAAEAEAPHRRALDTLLRRHRNQRNTYIDALAHTISAHAAERYPGLAVLVTEARTVNQERSDPMAERLLAYGVKHAAVPPLPGSTSR